MPGKVNIEEGNLKQGLLGLVLALVEIITDTLRLQAVRRMEGGGLAEEEVDALGKALKDLDQVLAEIKEDLGLEEAVASVRRQLDDVVDELLVRPADDVFLSRLTGAFDGGAIVEERGAG